jgi:hypothetical protein
VRLVVLILMCLAARAAAQPPPTPDVRPWAEGVPEDKQALALKAYEEGNAEFVQDRFAQAVTKYREALGHWDHPSIRFNMAVALINLGQPIEARESLDRALAFGEAPLGPDLHRQALTYQRLLDGQLTRLTIKCDEPDAEVSLDGIVLFKAPGSVTSWIAPGQHQLVATKPGYLTSSQSLALVPGTTETFDVRLLPYTSTTRTTRRWAPWKPYAVVASGALVAGFGGILYAVAASDYSAYDDHIRTDCPRGCSAGDLAAMPDVVAIKDRADSEQAAAFSLFVVGGALAVAGGVGLYLNQPRIEVVAPSLTPAIMPRPGGAVLTVDVRF